MTLSLDWVFLVNDKNKTHRVRIGKLCFHIVKGSCHGVYTVLSMTSDSCEVSYLQNLCDFDLCSAHAILSNSNLNFEHVRNVLVSNMEPFW